MKALATRLILWLCNRFDVWPIAENRINMGADKIARSQRWEAFANEEGGLFDMIEALRREAFEHASELPPEEVEKLQYFAMSDRNLRRLKQRVQSVIAQGKIEARNAERGTAQRILKSV